MPAYVVRELLLSARSGHFVSRFRRPNSVNHFILTDQPRCVRCVAVIAITS